MIIRTSIMALLLVAAPLVGAEEGQDEAWDENGENVEAGDIFPGVNDSEKDKSYYKGLKDEGAINSAKSRVVEEEEEGEGEEDAYGVIKKGAESSSHPDLSNDEKLWGETDEALDAVVPDQEKCRRQVRTVPSNCTINHQVSLQFGLGMLDIFYAGPQQSVTIKFSLNQNVRLEDGEHFDSSVDLGVECDNDPETPQYGCQAAVLGGEATPGLLQHLVFSVTPVPPSTVCQGSTLTGFDSAESSELPQEITDYDSGGGSPSYTPTYGDMGLEKEHDHDQTGASPQIQMIQAPRCENNLIGIARITMGDGSRDLGEYMARKAVFRYGEITEDKWENRDCMDAARMVWNGICEGNVTPQGLNSPSRKAPSDWDKAWDPTQMWAPNNEARQALGWVKDWSKLRCGTFSGIEVCPGTHNGEQFGEAPLIGPREGDPEAAGRRRLHKLASGYQVSGVSCDFGSEDLPSCSAPEGEEACEEARADCAEDGKATGLQGEPCYAEDVVYRCEEEEEKEEVFGPGGLMGDCETTTEVETEQETVHVPEYHGCDAATMKRFGEECVLEHAMGEADLKTFTIHAASQPLDWSHQGSDGGHCKTTIDLETGEAVSHNCPGGPDQWYGGVEGFEEVEDFLAENPNYQMAYLKPVSGEQLSPEWEYNYDSYIGTRYCKWEETGEKWPSHCEDQNNWTPISGNPDERTVTVGVDTGSGNKSCSKPCGAATTFVAVLIDDSKIKDDWSGEDYCWQQARMIAEDSDVEGNVECIKGAQTETMEDNECVHLGGTDVCEGGRFDSYFSAPDLPQNISPYCKKVEATVTSTIPPAIGSEKSGNSEECKKYAEDPGCSFVEEECISESETGECLTFHRTYDCGAEEPVVESTKTTTEVECDGEVECMGGECINVEEETNTNFEEATSLVSAANQMAQTGQNCAAGEEECMIFKGEANECKKAGYSVNCCNDARDAAKDIKIQKGTTYLQVTMDTMTVYGMYSATAGLGAAATSYGTSAAMSMYASGYISASTTSYLASAASMAGSAITAVGVAYAAYEAGKMVEAYAFQCDDSAMTIAIARKQKRAHKLGSYCAEEVGGGCYVSERVFCVFPSILGRVMQEQIRPQLEMGWGSPKDPNCSGVTLEQLAEVNWDEVDLSEWAELKGRADIAPENPSEINEETTTGNKSAEADSTESYRQDATERTLEDTEDVEGENANSTECRNAYWDGKEMPDHCESSKWESGG